MIYTSNVCFYGVNIEPNWRNKMESKQHIQCGTNIKHLCDAGTKMNLIQNQIHFVGTHRQYVYIALDVMCAFFVIIPFVMVCARISICIHTRFQWSFMDLTTNLIDIAVYCIQKQAHHSILTEPHTRTHCRTNTCDFAHTHCSRSSSYFNWMDTYTIGRHAWYVIWVWIQLENMTERENLNLSFSPLDSRSQNSPISTQQLWWTKN